MRTIRLALLAGLALGLAAGCAANSNAPAKLSGKVTYKGAPIPGGSVTFHSKDKGDYTAYLAQDGTYVLSDVPAGDMVVTVETESINPNKKKPTYGGGRGAGINKEYEEGMKNMGKPANTDAGARYLKIPPSYSNPEISGLTATLKAGKQVHDIDLKD